MPRGGIYQKFFYRDWRNADRFKPNASPPRQKFNGFVEFIFNPVAVTGIADSSVFRTQISSLVQEAKLPEIEFNVAVKNQYNMKRVVQTGFDIGSASISVLDTVSNEWLTVLMKYFSYHYNNPRNRTSSGIGNSRDQFVVPWPTNSETLTRSSSYMAGSFESNNAGFDVTTEAHFIDQIKLVTYAGGKGVEYIMFRPTITSFSLGDISVSDSGLRLFDIGFVMENFTVNSTVNFTMDQEDLARFENANIQFPMFDDRDSQNKNSAGYLNRTLEFLGDTSNPRWRSGQ